MTRADYDKLMADASPAVKAAGKRALGGEPRMRVTAMIPDPRPQKGEWAPGMYHGKCRHCGESFIGDKRASSCAPCAYSETVAPAKKPAIRIPKPRTPNKTEARFMSFAMDRWEGFSIAYEALTFTLPSGTKYTPDFLILPHYPHQSTPICVEVKGPHIHNQRSIHAFKEARAAFPFFRWIFAQWKDGDWALAELPQ